MGNRWYARLSDNFRNLGFTPSKADFDIWMWCCDDQYKYAGSHTDDITSLAQGEGKIINELQQEYKMKNVGLPTFLLGAGMTKKQHYWTMGPKHMFERPSRILKRFLGNSKKSIFQWLPETIQKMSRARSSTKLIKSYYRCWLEQQNGLSVWVRLIFFLQSPHWTDSMQAQKMGILPKYWRFSVTSRNIQIKRFASTWLFLTSKILSPKYLIGWNNILMQRRRYLLICQSH